MSDIEPTRNSSDIDVENVGEKLTLPIMSYNQSEIVAQFKQLWSDFAQSRMFQGSKLVLKSAPLF